MISQISIKSLNFTARSHVLAGSKKEKSDGEEERTDKPT